MSLSLRLSLFAVVLSATAAHAQAPPPTGAISRDTYQLQTAADDAYVSGEYAKAMRIYRDELAPDGDKYAQYMVGLMTLNGEGTVRDKVAGAAWLSVAADRGDEQLLAARDAAIGSLTAPQMRALQDAQQELSAQYGDCAVVSEKLASSRQRLVEMNQTNDAGDLVVIDNKAYLIDRRSVRRDIYERERYLKQHCAP